MFRYRILLTIAALLLGVHLVSCAGPHTASAPPTVIKPGVGYVDVAARAGIRFQHNDGHKGTATMMEQIGPGCALLDYDGDGWLDLYLLNGRDRYGRGLRFQNALYHNNRDGTFTDVTNQAHVPGTGYGLGAAVGDYDNDGHPDIYVCQYGRNVLYHNNGNGTFTDVTARAHVDGMDFGEPFHSAAAWIDYDRDGRLDLFVASYVDFEHGPRTCNEPGYEGGPRVPHGCAPTYYPPAHCILYHNNGDGTFSNVTRKAGLWLPGGKSLGVVVGDFNDDGWPDLFVANDSAPCYLLRNNRHGTFKEIGASANVAFDGQGSVMSAMGVDFGDFRNNGKLGLFVSDYQNRPNHLFENLGNESFTDVANSSGIGPPSMDYLGFGGGFLDYDNDGWPDIFVANGHVIPELDQPSGGNGTVPYRQHPQLFRNNRNGTFSEVTASAGPALGERGASRGVAWGDVWNRGLVDILVANNNGPPFLMRCAHPSGSHFLSLRLVGTRSNRDAIGARVYVTTGHLRQMQEVKTSCSFLSSIDPRLHFGLGQAAFADKVEVRWPRGGHSDCSHLAADRFYQLVEGQKAPGLQSIR